jgi:hypothetical protein
VDVAQERERELRRLGEGLVTEGAIPADREEDRAAILKRAGDLSQAGELGRSDTAPVVAVESEDDVRLPLEFVERDRPAEGGGKRNPGPTPSTVLMQVILFPPGYRGQPVS